MSKRISSELDHILDHKFPILDDGFVSAVDYMGGDSSIVNAARLTVKSAKKVHEDRGLIRYLMRHQHSTPFEFAQITIHMRIPMDAWRQAVRHRAFGINEYSTRYSEAIDACQKTPTDKWRLQSQGNRQGSSGLLPESKGKVLSHREEGFQKTARDIYQERLDLGVAKEQARKDLPLSTYTEAYIVADLRNLLHFLGLRMDSHAQIEIREYATVIGKEIVAKWCPMVWEAFNDYHPMRDATTFSRLELEIIKTLNKPSEIYAELPSDETAHRANNARTLAQSFGWLEMKADGTLKRNRERDECEDKLKELGLEVPWASK